METDGSEYHDNLLRYSVENGGSRIHKLQTEPSLSRDWAPGDATHALRYVGETQGWYRAPSLVETAPPTAGIYVIQAKPSGFIKIGYASDVDKRLASLQTGNHEELQVLRVAELDRSEESRIHLAMHRHRRRGEWFSPDVLDELNAYLDSLDV